jgi:hypothetical protein
LFYAANGTAALPSYSFTNDTATGVYLYGTGILGLAANATDIIKIDNSNVLTPLVTINAPLRSGLISGGTF